MCRRFQRSNTSLSSDNDCNDGDENNDCDCDCDYSKSKASMLTERKKGGSSSKAGKKNDAKKSPTHIATNLQNQSWAAADPRYRHR